MMIDAIISATYYLLFVVPLIVIGVLLAEIVTRHYFDVTNWRCSGQRGESEVQNTVLYWNFQSEAWNPGLAYFLTYENCDTHAHNLDSHDVVVLNDFTKLLVLIGISIVFKYPLSSFRCIF